MVGNCVGLLEFKTSPKPYPDHLIAMAAHGRLWEETHPQHQLSKFLEGACRMAALVTQTG
jgi:hypothetical protein